VITDASRESSKLLRVHGTFRSVEKLRIQLKVKKVGIADSVKIFGELMECAVYVI
jgi:hypothetical protein